jgi:hypothetical protein
MAKSPKRTTKKATKKAVKKVAKKSTSKSAATTTSPAPKRTRKTTNSGVNREAAGNRIIKMAEQVAKLVTKGQDPHVEIPSRTLSNVQFNEKKGIIELLDGKQKRAFFSLLGRRQGEGSQAKKFMQTIRVAEVCKRLIDADDSTSIRDLFYNLKVPVKQSKELIFNDQAESDPIIEDIEVAVAASARGARRACRNQGRDGRPDDDPRQRRHDQPGERWARAAGRCRASSKAT